MVGLGNEALADATRAADWYIDQGAWTAAVAPRVEIAAALARIAAEPGLGTPGIEGARILPLHRFPVSPVDRVAAAELWVIAVAAQRRRPGFWAGRVRGLGAE